MQMLNQRGLSFIELVVASLMVSVLASLALSNLSIFMDRSYDYHQQAQIKDLRKSIEAGKSRDLENPPFFEYVYKNNYTNKTMTSLSTTTSRLIPGFQPDAQASFHAWVFPRCYNNPATCGWAYSEYLRVHHCKRNLEAYHYLLNDGTELTFESPTAPTC